MDRGPERGELRREQLHQRLRGRAEVAYPDLITMASCDGAASLGRIQYGVLVDAQVGHIWDLQLALAVSGAVALVEVHHARDLCPWHLALGFARHLAHCDDMAKAVTYFEALTHGIAIISGRCLLIQITEHLLARFVASNPGGPQHGDLLVVAAKLLGVAYVQTIAANLAVAIKG